MTQDEKHSRFIRKFDGANMDIDLATDEKDISWKQDQCPWDDFEGTSEHKCAIKIFSICKYFYGVEYSDNLLCYYPHENPFKGIE